MVRTSMQPSREKLIAFRKAARQYTEALVARIEYEGLSMPQFTLLSLIGNAEDMLSMTAIAAAMGHTTAAATGLVDRIERQGLVKRGNAAHDRRKVIVEATAAGISKINRINAAAEPSLVAALLQYEAA